jgi:hypothetical protein
MRVSNPERTVLIQIAAATAVALLACVAVRAQSQPQSQAEPSASSGAVSAVWAPKQLNFIYRHATATYSCDGLQEKMKEILLKLGARADLQVRGYGCTRLVGPDPLAGVSIRMNVLQPADNHAGQAVPAHWKMVNLLTDNDNHDPIDASGDCDLVNEVRHQVLPLFATRNVDYSATCEQHQLVPGGTRLKAEVLVPDQRAAAASAAR